METEFAGLTYKEGVLEPKVRELIKFSVNIAIGFEHGAKLHLARAREYGATEEEISEAVAYAMRSVAAKLRFFAKAIVAV